MGGCFVVDGAKPLCGAVRVPAAKNSVLPLLAASLLCEGEVRLLGVPRLTDVECCLELLRGAGRAAYWQGANVTVGGAARYSTLPRAAEKMRASILFCAPLLAKLGRAEAPLPGGCRIGARPIDLHLDGLKKMGARQLEAGDDRLVLIAPSGLRGADISLRFASVGATETLLLAAACAKGGTVLRGAAKEPEIADLARFINLCGGCVRGAGSDVIQVEGRRALGGGEFAPLPDRIYASTMACAAAAAGGRVEIQGCETRTYAPVLDILERMGCTVERRGAAAVVSRFGRLRGEVRAVTGVYPAFATDAAPLLAAVMLCADGGCAIEDTIFEHRFGCAEGFARMGARVRVEGRRLLIHGGGALRGADVSAPDLRGGAALIVAALAAQGKSRVHGAQHIARGYAQLEADMSALGAQIAHQNGV